MMEHPAMESQEAKAIAKAQARADYEERRKRNWLTEKRIAGQFLAHGETTDEVPALDLIDRIYLLTWYHEKPVIVREGGEPTPWEVPMLLCDFSLPGKNSEEAQPAKQLDTWLKRTAQEQWGVRIKDWFQHARLELTATADATEVVPGTVQYYLFLCASASKLDDLPAESDWSRRTVTRKDLGQMLRQRYEEFDEILEGAHEAYVIRQAKQG